MDAYLKKAYQRAEERNREWPETPPRRFAQAAAVLLCAGISAAIINAAVTKPDLLRLQDGTWLTRPGDNSYICRISPPVSVYRHELETADFWEVYCPDAEGSNPASEPEARPVRRNPWTYQIEVHTAGGWR